MTSLAMIMPYSKKFYNEIVKLVFPNDEFDTISDFHHIAEYWSGDYIYNSNYEYPNECFDKDSSDIIARCRFLRDLDSEKAYSLALRFWNGVEELFLNKKYRYVFLPTIDDYTKDIVARVAEKNGAVVISLVQSFLNGYSRFTVRGERRDINRIISDEEVEKTIAILTKDDYKPRYIVNKNQADLDRFWKRRYVIEKIAFPIIKTITNDKDNYHYNTKIYSGKKDDYICDSMMALFSEDKDINIGEKDVFLPLHVTPEATVDYWCESSRDAYYEEAILELLQENNNVRFLVKDHPMMLGMRKLSFYKELCKCPNVILINPYASSNNILLSCNNVAVHTGTVGIEALLRGKKVYSFSKNYYSDLHSGITVTRQIPEEQEKIDVLRTGNEEFIRRLLNGLIPYKYTDTWGVDKKSDDLSQLANWIRCYLDIYAVK